MGRTTARAAVMQMIFEHLSGGQGGEETLQMVYDELRADGVTGVSSIRQDEPDEEDRVYISRVLDGVLEHIHEIDALIGNAARGWTVERMSLVDLTIMRLAVYEIVYESDIPESVSVSEALELTERYSDPDDKAFVNGILGTIVRNREV